MEYGRQEIWLCGPARRDCRPRGDFFAHRSLLAPTYRPTCLKREVYTLRVRMSASTSSVEEQSQARKLGIVVGLLGAASIGMTNRIRHRPIMYRE